MLKYLLAAALATAVIASPMPQAFAQTAATDKTEKAKTEKTKKDASKAEKKEPKARSAGQVAATERQRKCGTEWKAAKAAGTVEKGMTWPKYWSACNKRLKQM